VDEMHHNPLLKWLHIKKKKKVSVRFQGRKGEKIREFYIWKGLYVPAKAAEFCQTKPSMKCVLCQL